MSSASNGIGVSLGSKADWTRRCLAGVFTIASVLGWSASAQAAVYNVFTNSSPGNGAMTKNANDGFCSLAEAIDSVNAGSPQWNCADAFPGSSAIIQLWEGPGRPFAQNHFRTTSLTIQRDVALMGGGAYIDSTGTSGLVIQTNVSVEVNGFTLTYTGTNGGRLINNSGELTIFGSTLQNGNVSALAGSSANGGAIYNSQTGVISYIGVDVSFFSNKAARGGAIYNSTGTIAELRGLIEGNTATLAGGGIYNQSVSIDGQGFPNGRITANGVTIMKNSAKAGGGVFNRGSFSMTGGSITLNNASGTGSNETCTAGQSCDGAGGGIVTAPGSSTLSALFNTDSNTSIRANTATGFGGGVYTAGQSNMVGVEISDNTAKSGAAVYSVPQGFIFYCQIGSDSSNNPAVINNNSLWTAATGRYSILDGILLDNNPVRQCSISSTTIASGNMGPRFCKSTMLREGSVCPQ